MGCSKNGVRNQRKARLGRALLRLLADESGQGTVEYILLLTLVVSTSIYFMRTFIGAIDKGILRFGAQLEKDLKTGRAPLGVWSN